MMFLFIILAIILVLLVIFMIAGTIAAGFSFIVVFGDVIVCAFIILWIIKKILNRNK